MNKHSAVVFFEEFRHDEDHMKFNPATETQRITSWLVEQLGDSSAVLGLSGGIDSTVVAYLLTEAIGADRVQTLVMPSPTTPEVDAADAIAVAETLGVKYDVIPLAPLLLATQAVSTDFSNAHAAANLQSRLRMILLYARANAIDGRVVGTGNRSELLTGYFTKYGDGGVDILPIGHLYKTEVWQLAKQLDIPERIIDKAPSAGLHTGQTDEADLGMSYQQLDTILELIDKNQSSAMVDATAVQAVQQLIDQTRHKRHLPPMPHRL